VKLGSGLDVAEVKLGSAKLKVVGLSDPGRGRKDGVNEDAWRMLLPGWLDRKPVILVAADGMGGHKGGKRASQLVVKSFRRSYRGYSQDESPERFLERAVKNAHEAIRKDGASDPAYQGMGSTVVASLITEDKVSLVNVGDSRGYLIRAGESVRLTVDHSWVEKKVQSGVLTEVEARKHPKRNQLNMSLNALRPVSDIQPSFADFEPRWGDVLLLCTDGLWGVISEEEIVTVVEELPLEEAVKKLIDLANISLGRDNITVVLARWGSSKEGES
jgi:protein phosphatase